MSDENVSDSFRKVETNQHDHEANLDVVFGEINENGPDYHAVGGLGATALMLKTNLGLGVLSIPAIFDTLGMIPGVICIIAMAAITGWSQYMIGVFKRNHPEVYGIEDVAGMLWGSFAREFIGGAFFIFWIFVAASGMLSVSIALNALSTHATCTAVFVAVAAIIAYMFSSIQTLGRITWLAWVGVAGIITAILTLTIAVGVQGKPVSAPAQEGPWKSDFKLFGSPSFTDAISACSSLVFAFAGTPGYFNIISEMRDPRKYSRSVFLSQGFITAIYIAIGIVVYYFCGSYVASPALGSAGATMKKVCYGLALPGLLVSTISCSLIFQQNSSSFVFSVDLSTLHLTRRLTGSFGSAVPSQSSSAPTSSLALSLFSPFGIMWIYDNWHKGKIHKSPRWILMASWSFFIIIIGSFLMVAGTYGSIVAIIDSQAQVLVILQPSATTPPGVPGSSTQDRDLCEKESLRRGDLCEDRTDTPPTCARHQILSANKRSINSGFTGEFLGNSEQSIRIWT
ncbi:hypothetical protein EYC84_010188 [Monilinia fructicola]|uniref:Amino acid transporter transmembrane domain-containing protein n=1 Tax=Monilinia fructicola TaxID=38448 RepID=A0A5M9JCX1_MONFR|nr:hypothetical protein EYC84_010188 [Monilinia fructicola]